ncbi:type II toxin-antitoxin system HicB family antitoxin [Mesorhizobium sp. RIZ17]|uniref:type II toxin-antitoxin system HicB family antitoxin n=1 Tax=Mesorhizobium sp. RIZ17 TaxID=3132743 RepID=UPI003DA81C03
MRQYVGLIHKEEASDYGVSFPDFPGVVTAGASLGEARELAEQALAFHVDGLVEDGEIVPAPTSLVQVKADADRPYLTTIMVPLRIR